MELEAKHIHAPELYGNQWLNSEPVILHTLEDKIVLIDFWDYACINCIRTLPYMKTWYEKYRELGVVVVGIHTPEFHFGTDPLNVAAAVKRFEIPYPVVLDNDALLWSAYAIRYWPTRCLIDKDGYIRFMQHGEGGYLEFERALQQLLSETGYHRELPELIAPMRDEDRAGAVCYKPTGEIYLGYLRGALGNPEGYSPESTIEYADPGVYLAERFYASGKWMNERECLRFAGLPNEIGIIFLPYQANGVNVVMGSSKGVVCEMTLEQNGAALSEKIMGKDVIKNSNGSTSVLVDVPRMYSLVADNTFGSHLLKMTTSDSDLEIFSFTFTTCVIPELISTN